MSSVTDMSLSETDTHNSGNIRAGFGNGVLEIGNEVWAFDRGLELKATIESILKKKKERNRSPKLLMWKENQKIEDWSLKLIPLDERGEER